MSEHGQPRRLPVHARREGHQTSGLTTRLILAYAEGRGGPRAVEVILERCGLSDQVQELRDESSWFGFDTKVALFEAAAEIFDDPHVGRHIGTAAVDLNVLSGVKRLLRAVGSAQLVYSVLPRYAPKFTWAHRLELLGLSEGQAQFRYVDVSGVGYHMLDCEYNVGMLSCVPTMFGAQPAKVRHPQCALHGADACIYDVYWEEARSTLNRAARRWTAATVAAFAAASLDGRRGVRLAAGVPVVGASLLASQAVREGRQQNRSLRAEVRDQRELGERLFASLRDLVTELRVEEVLAKVVGNAQATVSGREFALLVVTDRGIHCRSSSRVPDTSLRALEEWANASPEVLDSPICLDALETEAALAPLATDPKIPLGALYSAPLIFRQDKLGALVALAHGTDTFDPQETAVLTAYADQAAIALANARLFARVEDMARRDSLTGLLNQREFDGRLARELTQAERYGHTLALVLLDLDGFKLVNDEYGHAEGDRVLRTVAAAIEDCSRAFGTCYRIGGDEFALVLPGASTARAAELAYSLQAAVEGLEVGVAASCGVAIWPEDGPSQNLLMFSADRALYDAKAQTGRRRQDGPLVGRRKPPVAVQKSVPADKQARDHYLNVMTTALARAVDAKDSYTRSHSETVSEICELLAHELGFAPDQVTKVALAGLLHDVGKIGVPDPILQKPEPLSDEEFEVMKGHPTMGHNIVAGADLPEEATWILHHHERVDGGGYPSGLAGEEIPIQSRIILVADAFEAMTSDRPYRPGRPVADALAELERHAETQFDPACVRALRKVLGTGARELFEGNGGKLAGPSNRQR